MEDVGIEFPDGADEASGQAEFGGRDAIAPVGEAVDAKRQRGLDALDVRIVGRIRNTDDANAVPDGGLRLGEVGDATDELALWRADTMHDMERLAR